LFFFGDFAIRQKEVLLSFLQFPSLPVVEGLFHVDVIHKDLLKELPTVEFRHIKAFLHLIRRSLEFQDMGFEEVVNGLTFKGDLG
jgi:hypothetical protein